MKRIKPFILSFFTAVIISSCGPAAITLSPIENTGTIVGKTSKPSDEELKTWSHADLIKDNMPGMSVDLAYTEILDKRKGKKVIVGVIDSGIDIAHEDLKNVIWTNEDEIPGNNKDDDKNGYTDDIHGWNFLGETTYENLELVRIVKKGDDGSDDYKRAKAEYDKEYKKALQNKERYEEILKVITYADGVMQKELGKKNYTKEDLAKITSNDQMVLQSAGILREMLTYGDDFSEVKQQVEGGIKHFAEQLNYHLNIEFNGRASVGDNPDDLNDKKYGNNNVTGPDKEEAMHGTHVAGIIAAQRDNNTGMNGVARNVEIMTLRAVPNGDEYDKDIALAIKYAADNGAKVINTSFGKYYSPHSDWVAEAIKYAASKDVLIVNAAGNEGYNLDEISVYPNDAKGTTPEIAGNFLTVGALHFEYGDKMVADFSNYGKYNVDVFAPGTNIWSTKPNNTYQFLQGTSMAAPAVTGIAALIRSYYPKLSAPQVKRIIIKSGLSSKSNVILSGDANKKEAFSNISSSGKMANLYNALILADKVSNGKMSL